MSWYTNAPNIVKVAVLCAALVLFGAIPQTGNAAIILGLVLLGVVLIEVMNGVQLT